MLAKLSLTFLGLHLCCYSIGNWIRPLAYRTAYTIDILQLLLLAAALVSAVGWLALSGVHAVFFVLYSVAFVIIAVGVYAIPYEITYPQSRFFLPHFEAWTLAVGFVLATIPWLWSILKLFAVQRS